MRRTTLFVLLVAGLALLAAPMAAAHETYTSEDEKIQIVLGEQNEPVYTYDWTNLDFIVSDNATGAPIEGVEETVEVTLIAPNGEELSLELEPQHGSEGRYAFVEDYFLTLPGQYEVRLEGTINGSDVTGEYLLPGPRTSMKAQAFPAPVDSDLRELAAENQALSGQVSTLESQVSDLEAQLAELEGQVAALEAGGTGGDEATADAPGFAALPLLAVAFGLAVLHRRRG